MVKVSVKWNKKVFEGVEVASKVPEFKAKLQELTVSNWHSSAYNFSNIRVNACLHFPVGWADGWVPSLSSVVCSPQWSGVY